MPFKKGVSGNPTGRAKLPPDIKAELRRMTPRALAALSELLDSSDDKVRMAAAKEVLDRHLGKPQAEQPEGVAGARAEADLALVKAKVRIAEAGHDPDAGNVTLNIVAPDWAKPTG